MANTKQPLTQEQKNKMGNVFAVLVTLLCILLPLSVIYSPALLFWFLIIVNFVSGPACLIGYLREVKRGIFSSDGRTADS